MPLPNHNVTPSLTPFLIINKGTTNSHVAPLGRLLKLHVFQAASPNYHALLLGTACPFLIWEQYLFYAVVLARNSARAPPIPLSSLLPLYLYRNHKDAD
ncbi:hypothetical protein VNO78_08424 [Psophocarpus tetragonolobus]|uniref:Uncharacterized protein n=1 Tax=Psophocarpus tetragonolobus TaxID=3891 RepID=A0AAN9XTR2_PSOTE